MEDITNNQPDTPDSVDLPETSNPATTGDAETTVDDVPQHSEQENKPPKGVQKRIDELTAQRRRAEQEADFYRKLLEDERAQRQPAAKQDQQQPTVKAPPKFEDFESLEDYVSATAEYKAEQLLEARQHKAEQEAQQRKQQEVIEQRHQTLQQKMQQAVEKYPDLPVLLSDPSLPVTDTVVEALMNAENFADVANHLAHHPDEVRRLAGLTPLQTAYEVAKLEARIAAQPVAKPSSAPAPLNTVRPSAAPATVPDPSKDPDGWIKWRNEQNRAR